MERTRWLPVDHEVLMFVQDHLYALETGEGGEDSGHGDAWTEGQAICEILSGLAPIIRGSKWV
jgi:hypothetical protein